MRADRASLLQLRDNDPWIPLANTWSPPGGHCEPGEESDECACREFLEETGYRLSQMHYLTRFLDDHADGFEPVELTVYWARYDGIQSFACREGRDLAFVQREQAETVGVLPYLVELWDAALAEAGGREQRDEGAARGAG